MKKDTYYDLVVANNGEKSILCVAPFCSGINEWDVVDVDGGRAWVEASCSVICGSDVWEFIKRICGNAEPIRITAAYKKSALDWEDEDDA